MIAKILKLFAGSHYKRFYKKTRPIVAKINKIEEQYQSLTDEQLRAKTDEFKARYAKGESLDSLLPEAFAAVKNAARRLCGKTITVCGPGALRRAANRRHSPPPEYDCRNGDRRRQNPRIHPSPLSKFADRQRLPPRHGKRIPRQARLRMDGIFVQLSRSVRLLDIQYAGHGREG